MEKKASKDDKPTSLRLDPVTQMMIRDLQRKLGSTQSDAITHLIALGNASLHADPRVLKTQLFATRHDIEIHQLKKLSETKIAAKMAEFEKAKVKR